MSKLIEHLKKSFVTIFLLISLIGTHSVFAQTKINEYERTNSDQESAYMDEFLIALDKQKESKDLIVIYVNSKNSSFRKLSVHLKGIKQYLKIRGALNPQRYSIQIKEGKPRKELWIYPKDVELPKSDLLEFKINDQKLPFHYGQTCVDCSPAVPLLSWNYIDFEHYSDWIKSNDNYKALIIIHQFSNEGWTKKAIYRDTINNVIAYRKLLVEDYGIPKNKVKIIIKKPVAGKDSPAIARFYIAKN